MDTLPSTTPIAFYFDFSSPYSYIASEWIEALAARHGRSVDWRAILLGATYQAAELKSPVSYPIKREYSLRDFDRSARYAGVPFTLPRKFPIPTQNAARIFWSLHAEDPARATAWARHGLRALFARGVDLSDPAALEALAVEFGLAPGAAGTIASDPVWKAGLKAANDAASPPASSAPPPSSSTASRSGATTAANRSSAGWQAGRTEADPTARVDVPIRLRMRWRTPAGCPPHRHADTTITDRTLPVTRMSKRQWLASRHQAAPRKTHRS